MCTELNEYDVMVEEFLKKTNTKVSIAFNGIRTDSLFKDGIPRNHYRVKLTRQFETGRVYSFSVGFTDSQYNTEKGIRPTKYDVLCCLHKWEVYGLEDFASNYGYDLYDDFGEPNKELYKIYRNCAKEYEKVHEMFYDVLDELREIY